MSSDSQAPDTKSCVWHCVPVTKGLGGEGQREDRRIPGTCGPASTVEMPSSEFNRKRKADAHCQPLVSTRINKRILREAVGPSYSIPSLCF